MINIESENLDLKSSVYVLLAFIQKSLDSKKPVNIQICVESGEKMDIFDGSNEMRTTQLYKNVNLETSNPIKFFI